MYFSTTICIFHYYMYISTTVCIFQLLYVFSTTICILYHYTYCSIIIIRIIVMFCSLINDEVCRHSKGIGKASLVWQTYEIRNPLVCGKIY